MEVKAKEHKARVRRLFALRNCEHQIGPSEHLAASIRAIPFELLTEFSYPRAVCLEKLHTGQSLLFEDFRGLFLAVSRPQSRHYGGARHREAAASEQGACKRLGAIDKLPRGRPTQVLVITNANRQQIGRAHV